MALLNKHGVRIEFHAVASLADRPLVQDTSRKRSAVVRASRISAIDLGVPSGREVSRLGVRRESAKYPRTRNPTNQLN